MQSDEERSVATHDESRTPAGLWTALGTAALLATWVQYFLIHQRVAWGVALIAVTAATGALAYLRRGGWTSRTILALAGVGVVVELLWMISSWYPAFVLAEFAAVALAFTCFSQAWRSRRRGRTTGGRTLARGVVRGGAGVLVIVAALTSAVVLVTAVSPAPLATLAVQGPSGASNSFDPPAPTQTREVDGVQLTNDIQYGTTYPNSYLDVYIADADPTVSRPTFVVVHGGGFILGDKSGGDPNAAEGGDTIALGNGPVLDAGYNVVSIGYALAPQYEYPTPVVQLGQALAFLQDNGQRYGLDMSRVVLSGGSAGGSVVGQYAAIETNPAYAEQMDIEPALADGALQALVLDSALIDPTRGDQTQTPTAVTDWLFNLASRSYFGMDQADLEEANILDHVTADFPPTFIADGNTGTFPDQARDLADELDRLGVENEAFLPTREQAVLGHGFMAADSRWTDEYNRLKVDFLADALA